MPRLSTNKSSEIQCKSDRQLSTENDVDKCWFAIRVSYSRELALKAILDAENIENFIPMRYEYIMKSGNASVNCFRLFTISFLFTPPVSV